MKRKLLIFAICITMALAGVLACFAESKVSLALSSRNINKNDTFTVTVSLKDTLLASMAVSFELSEGLSIESGKWVAEGAAVQDFNVSGQNGVFAFTSAKNVSGAIFELKVRVKGDAPQNNSVEVTVMAKNGGKDNILEETVKIVFELGCKHIGPVNTANAKAATCAGEGYTGDKVCGDCGAVLEKGSSIPALGHRYSNGKCTVCGAEDPDFVPTPTPSPTPAPTPTPSPTPTPAPTEEPTQAPTEEPTTDNSSVETAAAPTETPYVTPYEGTEPTDRSSPATESPKTILGDIDSNVKDIALIALTVLCAALLTALIIVSVRLKKKQNR